MNENNNKIQDNFEVLHRLHKNPNLSQRDLAGQLGFSLGKLNYHLQALKEKGLVKIENFKKPDKINVIQYVLTIYNERTKLTINLWQEK